MTPLISVHDLSYQQPDGTILFEHFTFSLVPHQKIGLVGKNGIGKSTLLKLLNQQLIPQSASIVRHGKISYLPQKIQDFSNSTVAQILNVDSKISALQKAELGLAAEKEFSIIQNDWDLMSEINILFTKLNINYITFERLGKTLSGGELMKALLARIFLEKPDLILFDEPTNNLDADSKNQFYEALKISQAGMLIVSHDRTLLNQMDSILEISNLGLKLYGGNFDFYTKERETENLAALHSAQAKEDLLQKQIKQEALSKQKQDRKSVHGKTRAVKEGMSVIERKSKMGSAQNTSARVSKVHEDKTAHLQSEHKIAQDKLRENYNIFIDIDPVKIPKNKKMIIVKNLNYQFSTVDKYLWQENLNFEVRGNTRVSFLGKNGSGKTTLLNLIQGKFLPSTGEISIGTQKTAVLDQASSMIDDQKTVLENLQLFAANELEEHDIRIRAGRFQFYGEDVFKKGFTLSGGERLRLSLACILAMNNTPEILILDEPTNNLDLQSIEVLTKALNIYTGCLIVVSHDSTFLEEIKIEKSIRLF